jgi:predicted SAM-dependent methyltransferase
MDQAANVSGASPDGSGIFPAVHPLWSGNLLLRDGAVAHLDHGTRGAYEILGDGRELKIRWDGFGEEFFVRKHDIYFEHTLTFDGVLEAYLATHAPRGLEIGSSRRPRRGWFCTDLEGFLSPMGGLVAAMDASRPFPIASETFDFVYAEHMIEHLDFDDGLRMLRECHRVLKPGGAIRIVTPSIGFLLAVMSPDAKALERAYKDWSLKSFVPNALCDSNAFFLNNFMRNWGHRFIHDRQTLAAALTAAGFCDVTECGVNASRHQALSQLENVARMPPGFLELESMVLEASRA